jgi:hypothetical protein
MSRPDTLFTQYHPISFHSYRIRWWVRPLETGFRKPVNRLGFGPSCLARRGLWQKAMFDPEKWQKERCPPAHFINLVF